MGKVFLTVQKIENGQKLCKFEINDLSLMSLEPPKTASKDAADDATLSIKCGYIIMNVLFHNIC